MNPTPRTFSALPDQNPNDLFRISGFPLRLRPLVLRVESQGPRLPASPGLADARWGSTSARRTHFRPLGANEGAAAGVPLAGVRAAGRPAKDSGRLALRTW